MKALAILFTLTSPLLALSSSLTWEHDLPAAPNGYTHEIVHKGYIRSCILSKPRLIFLICKEPYSSDNSSKDRNVHASPVGVEIYDDKRFDKIAFFELDQCLNVGSFAFNDDGTKIIQIYSMSRNDPGDFRSKRYLMVNIWDVSGNGKISQKVEIPLEGDLDGYPQEILYNYKKSNTLFQQKPIPKNRLFLEGIELRGSSIEYCGDRFIVFRQSSKEIRIIDLKNKKIIWLSDLLQKLEKQPMQMPKIDRNKMVQFLQYYPDGNGDFNFVILSLEEVTNTWDSTCRLINRLGKIVYCSKSDSFNYSEEMITDMSEDCSVCSIRKFNNNIFSTSFDCDKNTKFYKLKNGSISVLSIPNYSEVDGFKIMGISEDGVYAILKNIKGDDDLIAVSIEDQKILWKIKNYHNNDYSSIYFGTTNSCSGVGHRVSVGTSSDRKLDFPSTSTQIIDLIKHADEMYLEHAQLQKFREEQIAKNAKNILNRKIQFEKSIEGFPVEIKKMIKKGKIRIGMTEKQIILSWGPPNGTHSFTTVDGQTKILTYIGRAKLYIQDSILVAIEE